MSEARLFSTSASRWDKFEDMCGVALAQISDVANRASSSEHRTDEEKIEKLSQMKDYIKKVQSLQAEAKSRSKSYKEVERIIQDQGLTETTSDQLKEMHQRSIEKAGLEAQNAGRADGPEAKKVADMIQRISRADGEDEVEIEVTANPSTTLHRCPILNCELENPVKNSVCQHVYSLRGAIYLLYQTNTSSQAQIPTSLDRVPSNFSANCPMAMCSARIAPGQLKRDYATELTQRQMQNASGHRDSMDVEELM